MKVLVAGATGALARPTIRHWLPAVTRSSASLVLDRKGRSSWPSAERRYAQTLACSLSGPDLAQRITEWGRVASRATGRQVEKGRIVSTYPQDQEVLDQLRRLIAAEAECCAFMRFNVQEGADEVVVELRVPEDMSEEALAVMLGLVTQQPAPGPASS